MIDIVSLARHLRNEFPLPTHYGLIYNEMTDKLGEEPDTETQTDAYKALLAIWQRAGWTLDNDVGAVKLLEEEEAVFDNDAITIAKGNGRSTMVVSFARGERHDRIIWF